MKVVSTAVEIEALAQVSLMEPAHGWHQSDGQALIPIFLGKCLYFNCGGNYFHFSTRSRAIFS